MSALFFSTKKVSFLSLCAAIMLVLFACEKGEKADISDAEKEIVGLTLKRANGSPFVSSDITVSFSGDTIKVTLPSNTDITQLIPEVSIKGKSVSPASGTIQNFFLPVTYTVTAADGTTRKYLVIVAVLPPGPIVYIGSGDKNFYAIDALTGVLKWKYTGTESFAYSGATYHSGIVYVGGIDSYVYAFNAQTGAVLWKYKCGDTGIESDAVYANGTIYVGSNDDYLYALDALTGTLKWKFLTGGNISASPVIVNGVVYFGSSDSKLYALNAENGQLKWSFATGAMINQSGPAITNGVIYVGSRDGYVYALNAETGTEKWKFSSNGISFEQSSPTVTNGLVYIASWYNVPFFNVKGSFYALDVNTGKLVWEAISNTGISSSPCLADGRVFITADDLNIHCLNALTGATIWKKQILPNSASPAVAKGVVYVGGGGSWYIYAFDAATGMEKWRFPIPQGYNTSCPLIIEANGEAYYAGDSGAAS